MILGRSCPSIDEVRAAVFAYLPRGRAWQTRSGGPHPGSVLYGYWSAVADEVKQLYDRACALELELLCSTAVETKPEWAAEFSLPDGCGVEQDPCRRGRPILGDLCDLLESTAAGAGFSIVCSRAAIYCGERVGRARAGRARAGGSGRPRSRLVIQVDVSAMEQLPAFRPARAGRYRTGLLRRCGFDVAKLRCVLEPFVPAHAEILIQPVGSLTVVKPLVPPAVDVLGPYLSTPQSVNSRPGRTGDPAGAGFSWWKDCTDENAEDGTPIPAEALNNFKAQFVTLFQTAGLQVDDDRLAAWAIQLGMNFAVATGTANAWVVDLPLAPLESF